MAELPLPESATDSKLQIFVQHHLQTKTSSSLVLCQSSLLQVNTSNVASRHVVRLSPSSCCKL